MLDRLYVYIPVNKDYSSIDEITKRIQQLLNQTITIVCTE